MRGQVTELLKRQNENYAPTRDLWYGEVASDPLDLSDRISVIVPDFDPTFVWENCFWQSRDETSLPARGDRCVVILDNRNQAWVLGWWPYTE